MPADRPRRSRRPVRRLRPLPARRRPSSIGPQPGEIGADASTSPDEVDRNLLAGLPPSVASALGRLLGSSSTRSTGPIANLSDTRSPTDSCTRRRPRSAPSAALSSPPPLLSSGRNSPDCELHQSPPRGRGRRRYAVPSCSPRYARLPADVVRHALRGWAKREVFFPALAEIRDELQRTSRPAAPWRASAKRQTHLAEAAE